MKNCTKHFLERWTERIVGIKTERERNDYITSNRQMIIDHANTTFEHADFIYVGQIGNNTVKNFYIKDDIIFVANTSNDALITVYKVDLGFTPELNATVRRGLLEEVMRLTAIHEDVQLQVIEEVEKKYAEADMLEDQIKLVKEQLLLMEKQRDFIKQEATSIKSKSVHTDIELRKFTSMLVNSKEYKDDLRSI